MLVKERLRYRADQVQRNGSKTPRRFSGKLLLWMGITLPCLGVIYWHIVSAGIRVQMPVFGLPLRKLPLPGFSYLGRFAGRRSPISIAIGGWVFLEENFSGSPKTEACAGAVVE